MITTADWIGMAVSIAFGFIFMGVVTWALHAHRREERERYEAHMSVMRDRALCALREAEIAETALAEARRRVEASDEA